MPNMRAKLRLHHIDRQCKGQETLYFHAVSKSSAYPEDGSDENNTFAKFSPSANLQLTVANPNLLDKFETGKDFYVDFTPAE